MRWKAAPAVNSLHEKVVKGGREVRFVTWATLLQHIISNQPQSSQQPAHIRRADLKVISTDKFRETVIRGISQTVFV